VPAPPSSAAGPIRVLGLDVGGTKLAAGVVRLDRATTEVESMASIPTEVERRPDEVVGSLVRLGRKVLAGVGLGPDDVAAVGASCGGPLDAATGVIYGPPPNLPGWLHVPLTEMLAEAFGRPTRTGNDGSACALAEARFGGWDADPLAYVTISTGLGGGLVVGGEVFAGAAGNGGEPGHIPLIWDGRACACGSRGCAEAYVSGASIGRRATERFGETQSRTLSARDVVVAAQAGDPDAQAFWAETLDMTGAWLAGLVNIWEPALLVLGGGVTRAGESMLLDPLRHRVQQRAMPAVAKTVGLAFSRFGDASGVMGAAAMAVSASEGEQG